MKNIGYLHGFIAVIGGITLSYLTMMCFSKFIPADDAIKIIPAYIITPLLIPFYGIWLLFSKSIIVSTIKLFSVVFFLLILLKAF